MGILEYNFINICSQAASTINVCYQHLNKCSRLPVELQDLSENDFISLMIDEYLFLNPDNTQFTRRDLDYILSSDDAYYSIFKDYITDNQLPVLKRVKEEVLMSLKNGFTPQNCISFLENVIEDLTQEDIPVWLKNIKVRRYLDCIIDCNEDLSLITLAEVIECIRDVNDSLEHEI